MDTPPEDTTDEQLADLIADPDTVDQSDAIEDISAGSVEVGIPPQLNQEGDGVDSSEESFSINDFDEDFHADTPPSQEVEKEASVDLPVEEAEIADSAEDQQSPIIENNNKPNSSQNGDGDVAQFRQTLASLSRQLELDRLAFLHKSLQDSGEQLPSLNEIASDITGKRLIKPSGDLDQYGKRPAARLEGWLSGLSFGVSKRAKKFSK
ncbi:MAG: hypothetical protein HN754_05620 [Opitutae bacterium]|nr:hypothetical protein [Opitutae bacterium]